MTPTTSPLTSEAAPTIWICGLSQSGKTTLGQGVATWLQRQGVPTHVLDGRDVREQVGGFLGYSREERIKVGRIMAAMASTLNRNGIAVVSTAITPYQESRSLNREIIDNYFEIYLRCPVEVCIGRDRSGNYDKALRGDLRHFIGIDDPFELPTATDLVLDTDELDAESCIENATRALSELFVR